MEKLFKNEELEKNSNQPLNQKPFDVVMNENYLKNLNEGSIRTPFVPIVKEQSIMDEVIKIESEIVGFKCLGYNYFLGKIFPNTLLEVNKDDEGNLTSIYVLYPIGGKLYKVVSQKDYGVIKSRMELKNGKYIPYDKCDLVPFEGTIEEYDGQRLVKSITYKNGVKDGECFSYYVGGDRENDEEKTYHIIKFVDGKKTNSKLISSNKFDRIPSKLTTQTNQFLTEDIFYTIVHNGLYPSSLESFLEKFVVLNNTDFVTNDYGISDVSNQVLIQTKELNYGIGINGLSKYLIEECDYPYYEIKKYDRWDWEDKTYYKLMTSGDYYYESEYHPKVFSLVKSGETTKLFIEGELVEETIDGETNPIVLEFQKEVLQNLSDEMKSSYELELKREEIKKQREEEQKEMVKDVLGLSINSFPID